MNSEDDDVYDFKARVKAFSDVFRRAPYNAAQELEKLGFTYVVDDSENEEELAEERTACPANASEKALVEYFESKAPPDETLLRLWRQETFCDEPNYPLWRRYFRQGNVQLKALLLFGLDRTLTDNRLLDALWFLHQFSPILKELIARYLIACDKEEDETKFAELAQDFEGSTGDSGYEALQALALRYPAGGFKARCVARLIAQRAAEDDEVVSF